MAGKLTSEWNIDCNEADKSNQILSYKGDPRWQSGQHRMEQREDGI
jgi:hypothetical protein